MDISLIIIFLGLLFFSAHLFNALFSLTSIPNVLLLMAIGILIGPVAGFISPADFGFVGPVFTSITLILILFQSGTNLKISDLAGSIGSAFLLTVFNFIISAAIATAAAYAFIASLDLVTASFFGVIVGGTSSAVVIPMVTQLKMNQKGQTILLLESALSDVLCLVIGLALLDAMKEDIFELRNVADRIWKSFLLAILIGMTSGLAWSMLLNRLRKLQNYTFSNLALVFIIYGVTEYMGYNGGIAALGFGIVLGNAYLLKNTFLKKVIPTQELLTVEKNFFTELAFIVQTYFFVYVGLCMQFGSMAIYLIALLIVAAIILSRPLSVKLFVRNNMPLKDLSIMSVMMPKGLVPAILASIPVQLGLAGGERVQDLSYAVILTSIVLCTVLIMVVRRRKEKEVATTNEEIAVEEDND